MIRYVVLICCNYTKHGTIAVLQIVFSQISNSLMIYHYCYFMIYYIIVLLCFNFVASKSLSTSDRMQQAITYLQLTTMLI